MRLHIENGGTTALATPWPFRGAVAAGASKDLVIQDKGIEALVGMTFYLMCQRKDGVVARLFRGTPEKEYEVVLKGAMPSFVEKVG